MESFRYAITSLCPHLSLNISDAKILNDAEIVLFFPVTDDVTPLTDMLKKYNIETDVQTLDTWTLVFIYH
jgi:hypothetical protein